MLAFVVPLGFESVAAEEIEQVLGKFGTVLRDETLDCEPKTSLSSMSEGTTVKKKKKNLAQGKATFDVVRFLPFKPAGPALFRKVFRLSSIESAVIVTGERVVPREFWESPDADGLERWFASVGRGDFETDRHVEGCLQIWGTARRVVCGLEGSPGSGTVEEDGRRIKYRATVHRQAYRPVSGMNSTAMSGALGFGVGEKRTSWDVSLQAFDLEVVGIIEISKRGQEDSVGSGAECRGEKEKDGGSAEEGETKAFEAGEEEEEGERRLIYGYSVPRADEIRRRNRTVFGKTSLRPAVAYCLVRSALNRVDMTEGCTVLDPCCGAATIPIEAGLNFPKATVIAGDVVPAVVLDQAFVNVSNSRAPVDLFLWDARALPFRDGTIDVVVSDLPWGQREGSYRMNCKLYPKLLKCLSRAMKPGALAHLITGDTRLLRRVVTNMCKYRASDGFDIVEEREVRIGFTVTYFVLRRR